MNKKTKSWFHGLSAAIIGGGAGAVTASPIAAMIAPDKFNLTTHIGNFFLLAGITFGVNGFMAAMFYLKQSPLPPENGNTEFITKPPTQ